MELIAAVSFLFSKVRTNDTTEAELLAAAKEEGYSEDTVKLALSTMVSSGSIVKGRAEDTYQRWHGELAQSKRVR